MAPRKKQPRVHALEAAPLEVGAFREYKLRLPAPTANRVAAKAQATGRPQSRVITDILNAAGPQEDLRSLDAMLGDLNVMIARYSARIIAVDLRDDVMTALREALKADEANDIGLVRQKLARLRVLLNQLNRLPA